MKQTKRLLSIVLMLTMLLSMFTVMASATSISECTCAHDASSPAAGDEHFDAVTATCTTKNTPEYWQCAECGGYYWSGHKASSYSPITSDYSGFKTNPSNHSNPKHFPASAATCTKDGNVDYWYCSDCGVYWNTTANTSSKDADSVKIAATGHTPTHHEATKGNCTTAGNKEYWECTTCGAYFLDADCKKEVEATDVFDGTFEHVLTHVEAKPASLTEAGNIEYWYCKRCEKYFNDKIANDFSEIEQKDTIIPKLTEKKNTVTVKIDGSSNGKVTIKGYTDKLINGYEIKMSATEEYTLVATPDSKCTVSWYLDGKYVSSKTEYTLKNIEKDCTLKVVFEKKSGYTHTHDWVWAYNDTYHWKECQKSGCDEIKSGSKAKHNLKTYYRNGYYYSYCTTCDYDSWDYYYSKDHTSSHTGYDYEDYNATYHWKECKKCDYAVKEYHTWVKNTASKTKSSYPYVCKYCGRLSKTNDSCYLPFHDVNDSYWYYDDVLYAYLNGLMDGISVNDFGATQNTTRAQVVTILWRLTGEPRATRENKFKDVSSSAYYNNAISWAVDAGIVDGFDAYTFKPNDNVTREQLAAILYRYAAYMNLSTYGASNLLKFDDYYSIGTWARDAMAWANYHGLINGVGYSKIDPKGYATRAQVAAILHRFAVEFA